MTCHIKILLFKTITRRSKFSIECTGLEKKIRINWRCYQTWKRSSINTAWCLLGCSIGDLGTIGFFQYFQIEWNPIAIMALAIINGLITSILLETIILLKQMSLREAIKVAIGMSMISMISMEVSMNCVDLIVTGGAKLNAEVIPLMLLAGFITPLPYNYWQLKALGRSCH